MLEADPWAYALECLQGSCVIISNTVGAALGSVQKGSSSSWDYNLQCHHHYNNKVAEGKHSGRGGSEIQPSQGVVLGAKPLIGRRFTNYSGNLRLSPFIKSKSTTKMNLKKHPLERASHQCLIFPCKTRERFWFPGPLFLAILPSHSTHFTTLDLHSQRSSRSKPIKFCFCLASSLPCISLYHNLINHILFRPTKFYCN